MRSRFLLYVAVLLSAEMYFGKVAHADATPTTLQDYLNQVHGKNQEQVGSQIGIEAAKLKAFESELIFTPKLFAETRIGSDGKPFNPPLLTYDRIDMQSYSAGLTEQFDFGLQTKLYYSLTHTSYINSPQLTGQPAAYYDANPTPEVSMPLWGNGFGRTSRAQKSVTIKSNEAEEFGFRARAAGNDVEAENTYWSLVVAREVLRVQKNALTQAQAILSYVKKMRIGILNALLPAPSACTPWAPPGRHRYSPTPQPCRRGPAGLPGRQDERQAAPARRQGRRLLEQTRSIITAPGSLLTASILRDIEDGAPIEAEHSLGDLVRRGNRVRRADRSLRRLVSRRLKAFASRRHRAKAATARA